MPNEIAAKIIATLIGRGSLRVYRMLKLLYNTYE